MREIERDIHNDMFSSTNPWKVNCQNARDALYVGQVPGILSTAHPQANHFSLLNIRDIAALYLYLYI